MEFLGNKLLQIISAKWSERYIQTQHDMCSVMFRFWFLSTFWLWIKVNIYKKDVFLLKFEHLLITKQYPAN